MQARGVRLAPFMGEIMSRHACKSFASYAAIAFSLLACSGAETSDDSAGTEDAVSAGDAITMANYRRDARVREVASIAADVEQQIARRTLVKTQKENLCGDEGFGDDRREKFAGADGKVRKVILGGGTGDSYQTTELTYDAAGKLRFGFQKIGTTFGLAYETRSYFAADGTKFWEMRREGHLPEGAPADLSRAPDHKANPGEEIVLPESALTDAAKVYAAPPE